MGYVAYVLDSFTPRGLGKICADSDLMAKMARNDRIEDAKKALAYLTSLPYVDKERIAVMGWSHGAWTTVEIMARKNEFRGGIALYPYCSDKLTESVTAPTLIMIGEWDDWTPAKNCTAYKSRNTGPLELIVYPKSYHSFDDPRNSRPVNFIGHTLQYNAAATADSMVRVREFLEKVFK
jgi:dienelactone hydrolase